METPAPKLVGIRLTANPQSDVWQTPLATPGFPVCLVGWITEGTSVEAGVPLGAMQVLSESLTRLAVVTFLADPPTSAPLAPNRWHQVGGEWVMVLTRTNSDVSRSGSSPLIATTNARVAQELFRSDSFDWTQQAQIVLLSEPGHPPAIVYDLVEQCLRRTSIAEVIRDLHLLGVLYPAVDGDFAAVLSNDTGFADDFQRELRRACHAAQVSFAAISEESFKRTQWTG